MVNEHATDSRATAYQRYGLSSSLYKALIIGILLSAVGGFLSFMLRQRESARRMSTTNNFRIIAIALYEYNFSNGRLPYPTLYSHGGNHLAPSPQTSTSIPLCSWRFAITSYIASYSLATAYDMSWKSPVNAGWMSVAHPFAYDSWGDGVNVRRRISPIPSAACAFAVTGPGTAFGDSHFQQPCSLNAIDGDTIIVVETRNSRVHWMSPGDFDIRTMPRTINDQNGGGISGRDSREFHVIFADGSVWLLSREVSFGELEKFFTVDGARVNDREQVLSPYRVASYVIE